MPGVHSWGNSGISLFWKSFSTGQMACILPSHNEAISVDPWYMLGFLSHSAVNNLPAMQETWGTRFWSLGQEVPLEEKMAIHSGILAWKIPWTEEPGGLQSTGSQSRTWLSDCWMLSLSSVNRNHRWKTSEENSKPERKRGWDFRRSYKSTKFFFHRVYLTNYIKYWRIKQ